MGKGDLREYRELRGAGQGRERFGEVWVEGCCSVTLQVLLTVTGALLSFCCHLLLVSRRPAKSPVVVYCSVCQIPYCPILDFYLVLGTILVSTV